MIKCSSRRIIKFLTELTGNRVSERWTARNCIRDWCSTFNLSSTLIILCGSILQQRLRSFLHSSLIFYFTGPRGDFPPSTQPIFCSPNSSGSPIWIDHPSVSHHGLLGGLGHPSPSYPMNVRRLVTMAARSDLAGKQRRPSAARSNLPHRVCLAWNSIFNVQRT